MLTDSIEYTITEGIGLLRVNRPEARNALNWQAQERFAAIIQEAAADHRLRALILTGAGQQAFVSGGDLKELANHPEPEAAERLNRTIDQDFAPTVPGFFPGGETEYTRRALKTPLPTRSNITFAARILAGDSLEEAHRVNVAEWKRWP